MSLESKIRSATSNVIFGPFHRVECEHDPASCIHVRRRMFGAIQLDRSKCGIEVGSEGVQVNGSENGMKVSLVGRLIFCGKDQS